MTDCCFIPAVDEFSVFSGGLLCYQFLD